MTLNSPGRKNELLELGAFARKVMNGERIFCGYVLVDTQYTPDTEKALAKAGIMFPAKYAEKMSRIPTNESPDNWSFDELAKVAATEAEHDYLFGLFTGMQETALRMREKPVHFHGFRFSNENGGAQPINVKGLFLPYAVLEEGTYLWPAVLPELTMPGAVIKEDSGFSERMQDINARLYGERNSNRYKVAKVDGMNIVGARMKDTAMQGVDLSRVNMAYSIQDNVDYTRAKFYPTTNATGAKFISCDFRGSFNPESMIVGKNGGKTTFTKCTGY